MKLSKTTKRRFGKSERGQAMALIAFGFIGLVAFIGLAIDAGIVFAHIGHLRRGVDSAALAAANQIRQGWNDATITSAAEELILLNLPAANAGVLNQNSRLLSCHDLCPHAAERNSALRIDQMKTCSPNRPVSLRREAVS